MFISLRQLTPLLMAARNFVVDAVAVAFLVDKGADVNIRDPKGVSTSIDINIPMEKGLEMCEYEYFFQVT